MSTKKLGRTNFLKSVFKKYAERVQVLTGRVFNKGFEF